MGLILVDIDRVLAMGPDGGECRPGDAIYRASPSARPEAIIRPREGVTAVVLTHRNRAEARELLDAAGLAGIPDVITANDLLAESVRLLVHELRYRGLAKDVARRLLRQRHGWTDPSRTAVMDDKAFNLVALITAGVARWGLHVPAAVTSDEGGVLAFDMAAGLRLAGALVAAEAGAAAGIACTRVGADGTVTPARGDRLDGPAAGFIFETPRLRSSWPELSTGRVFHGSVLDPVAVLRAGKRVLGAARRGPRPL